MTLTLESIRLALDPRMTQEGVRAVNESLGTIPNKLEQVERKIVELGDEYARLKQKEREAFIAGDTFDDTRLRKVTDQIRSAKVELDAFASTGQKAKSSLLSVDGVIETIGRKAATLGKAFVGFIAVDTLAKVAGFNGALDVLSSLSDKVASGIALIGKSIGDFLVPELDRAAASAESAAKSLERVATERAKIRSEREAQTFQIPGGFNERGSILESYFTPRIDVPAKDVDLSGIRDADLRDAAFELIEGAEKQMQKAISDAVKESEGLESGSTKADADVIAKRAEKTIRDFQEVYERAILDVLAEQGERDQAALRVKLENQLSQTGARTAAETYQPRVSGSFGPDAALGLFDYSGTELPEVIESARGDVQWRVINGRWLPFYVGRDDVGPPAPFSEFEGDTSPAALFPELQASADDRARLLKENERERFGFDAERDRQSEDQVFAYAHSIANTFTRSFANALKTGDYKSIGVAVHQQITASVLDAFVSRPLANLLQGVISGFVPSADGNVFSNGAVVPFQYGGVIDRPTFFPLAGGKVGLAGESGAEAVVPLKRGRDGKLGVAGGGGSVTLVQNFYGQQNEGMMGRSRRQLMHDLQRVSR